MSIIRRSESINVLLKQYRLRKFMQQILVQSYHGRSLIGKRDVVGYGFNGSYTYYDTTDMPYPAIRFREETEEITRLREKEKNDWKQLTLEEKKKLYRHSFCLTLSEIEAPTGEWKYQLSIIFFLVGIALYYFSFARRHFFAPLPKSMTPEGKQETRDMEILYKSNPIFGLASKFDYEKGDWK
ncbi:slowmo protein [Sarcoptes scabiei]|nr:slowmo protein [Sarcoptes scabiei]